MDLPPKPDKGKVKAMPLGFSEDSATDERKYRMTYYRGVVDFKQYSVYSLPESLRLYIPLYAIAYRSH